MLLRLEGMNTLVTGSKGFIGKHLVSVLQKEGATVLEIDLEKGIDLTNWKQLNEFLKNERQIDVIFHLAAIVFIPYAFKNPRITYKVNTFGTLNMLEIAKEMNVNKFVFASTYVYGPPQYLPIDEKHPIQATNPYTRSKIIAEELCKGYHEEYGLNCIILRPFNIYGKGQNKDFLIPYIIDQLPSEKIVLKDPNPLRDYVYIDDVISAYIKAATYGSKGFEIFNIGTGVSYSVKEIVDRVLHLSKRKIKVTYTSETRKNEIMNTVANIKKANEKLGWQPRIDIDAGLSRMLKDSENSKGAS